MELFGSRVHALVTRAEPAEEVSAGGDGKWTVSVAFGKRELTVAAGIGLVGVAGACCWIEGLRRKVWEEHELEVLLARHVFLRDLCLVQSDVKQGADVLFRRGYVVHSACSEVSDDTHRLLEALLAEHARDETFRKRLSRATAFSRLERAAWSMLESRTLWAAQYWNVSPSLLSPVSRLIRKAKQLFERELVFSLDPYLKALEVLVNGPVPLDPNVHDFSGATPLHLVLEGTSMPSNQFSLASLRVLLSSAYVDINCRRKTDGATALHVLCERLVSAQDVESLSTCISLLLETGTAEVNAPDARGNTPLHLLTANLVQSETAPAAAALTGGEPCDSSDADPPSVPPPTAPPGVPCNRGACLAAVELLLRNGADRARNNAYMVSPYVIASRAGHVDLCKVITAEHEQSCGL
ncbi:hypothetical protein DIPPA_09910 [Diplonema papillatum]|nr:hypothetical protein DIPPA_09910 [Diplonema papillatum]